MIDEGIENLGAGSLSCGLAVTVVDVVEQTAFILGLEVVPVLAADKHPAVAVLQFQIVNTLEDLGEGLAALEVQSAIIIGLGRSLAAVAGAHQIRVRTAYRPAGTDGQGGVELPLDFAQAEVHGLGWCNATQGDGNSQSPGLEDGMSCCCSHAALLKSR